MKNAFVIVTLSGLLTACAVAPQQQLPIAQRDAEPMPAGGATAVQTAEASADAVPADSNAEEADLPKVELTSALLYQLMKAEFEIRKGNWKAGYQGLMALARQTRDPRLARRAAELAMQSREAKDAMASVQLWRELAPRSDEALQYHIGLALMSDNLQEAEQLFAKQLKDTAPQARGMAMYRAQQFIAQVANRAAGAAMLDRLLAPYDSTFEACILLAQNASRRGDNALALQHAQRALALKPDSEVAVLTLAEITREPAQMRTVLKTFLAAHPQSRDVRLTLARVMVADKDYPAARKEFELLLAQQPEHLGTLYGLGLVAVQMNDRTAAEQYFSRYVSLAEQNGDAEREPGKVLLLLSQLANERGDRKAALAWLEKVSESDSEVYFSAQMQRAALLARQGDVAGARKLLAGLQPEQASVRAQLVLVEGQILRDAGQVDAAYQLMADGARRYPTHTELLYDFALVAERTGHMDVMESTLRAIIKQAPDNHHAYNALGYSLAERNVRLSEALELIGKALQMAPDDPFIMDSMGWVQYRLGNLTEAEAHLRRAYALRGDADIAVHLGEVLWSKGQKAAAQQLWREARAKDPKNDSLRSTLSRLQQSL